MAAGTGPGSDDLRSEHLSLLERLEREPEKHHVFQALRILEATHPETPRLGESRRPRQDPVRLGQEAETAFPPSTVAAFRPGEGGGPARLTNRFFGLFGPNGPLPLHLTAYARDRQRNHRDPTFLAFANMFTHRMMSLLYRAWASGQPAVSHDRGEDPVADKVAALAGFHGSGLKNRDAMPDLARLHFAGLLASGPRHAEGLVSILSAFFDVPVRVQQFVGCWLDLEPDDRWQLGARTGLGRSTSLGQRVWSRAAKFRIRIGPLSLRDYERLLPGSGALERLRAIVRTYAGDELDWDVNLILAGDEVPRARLDGTTRLGHTGWIGGRLGGDDERPDAEDLFLHPGLNGTAAQP